MYPYKNISDQKEREIREDILSYYTGKMRFNKIYIQRNVSEYRVRKIYNQMICEKIIS